MVITLVSHLPSCITGFYIIWYRHRQGIAKGLLYRIGRYYWLPNPIDCLITLCSISTALRIILFIIILVDWPKCLIVRNFLYVATTTLLIQCVLLFVIGIIAHIPSALIQSKFRFWISSDRFRIWAPGPHTLSWIIYITVPFFSLVNQPLSIVMGLAGNAGDFPTYNQATVIITAFLAISMAIMTPFTAYYQFGFHRIMSRHINNLSERTNTSGSEAAEYAAAVRFRTIFWYLNVGLIIFTSATICAAFLLYWIRSSLWSNILFFGIQNIIIFPLVAMIVFWQVRASSFAHVYRRKQSRNNDSYKTQDDTQSSQSRRSTIARADIPALVFNKTDDPQRSVLARVAKDDPIATNTTLDNAYHPTYQGQLLHPTPLTSLPSIPSSLLDTDVEAKPHQQPIHNLLSLHSRKSSSVTRIISRHSHSASTIHRCSSPLLDDIVIPDIRHSDTEHPPEFRTSDYIDTHPSHINC
jgi:hypothetical protein